MSVPLYQAKAELFRTLGHPVRIRALELLQDGPKQVRELLAEIDVEAAEPVATALGPSAGWSGDVVPGRRV